MNLSGIFGAAFAGVYEDATLHRRSATDDGSGSIAEGAPVPFSCKAQVERAAERMQRDLGAASKEMRVLILRSTLQAEPDTDDELEILTGRHAGTTFSLSRSDGSDPGGAYWDLKGTARG